ncbi:MAG: hypothetical protein K0U52_06455 [Gammaproteobacteria bacterium]|nr:hypothetical protein [Gammaproteobacteria bacterium]
MSGVLGGVLSVASGIFGAASANKKRRDAKKRRKALQDKLNNLENNRQDVINPYEDVVNLNSMISNPFASLGVATQAAEMKIEQADISLANTLDTLRATGASAGGATALAQAALQSKKGVAASIEAQEAQNEKLRAQGEQTLQRQKMAEAQRIQGAEVAGKSFVFNQTEQRQVAELDRVSSQLVNQQNLEAQATSDTTSALTGMIGGAIEAFGV